MAVRGTYSISQKTISVIQGTVDVIRGTFGIVPAVESYSPRRLPGETFRSLALRRTFRLRKGEDLFLSSARPRSISQQSAAHTNKPINSL